MNPVRQLRIIGFIEGVSFMILFFIAMPLKYFADSPMMVKIFGSIHGVLFLIYVVASLRAAQYRKWNMKWLAVVLAASLIPIGTFLLDPKLKPDDS